MALEAFSTNELLNFIIYSTISANPHTCNNDSSETSFLPETCPKSQDFTAVINSGPSMAHRCSPVVAEPVNPRQNKESQGRKKRSRRPKVCKNKEEAETQRMTHIAVERNRRKQMNEHLAVLRSLMPQYYVQKGDQASIVGGAIEYVKELEHHLHSLQAQKLLLLQEGAGEPPTATAFTATASTAAATATATDFISDPSAHFFEYPLCTWEFPNKYTCKSKAVVANIEVTLIETHANLRVLSRKSIRLLSKMVAGLQTLYLTILHLNLITLDPLVLYSINVKVEEGCHLSSADDIAGAVHHMLKIIEEEATLC